LKRISIFVQFLIIVEVCFIFIYRTTYILEIEYSLITNYSNAMTCFFISAVLDYLAFSRGGSIC